MYGIFVFKYTSTTEIYTYCLTPSRHGALPCCALRERAGGDSGGEAGARGCVRVVDVGFGVGSCRSNPPCGETMGRWQREALTEGLWREAAAPPPSPAATVPPPIASRQGGSDGSHQQIGRGSCRGSVWKYV